jgi:integrase
VVRVVFPNEVSLAARYNIRARDLKTTMGYHGMESMAEVGLGWPRTTAVAVRDHFTQAEVDVIIRVSAKNLRDCVLIRIMAETGLRRRAISWLTVDAIYDTVARDTLPTATAMEKGLVVRSFRLSKSTRAIVCQYVENHLRKPYKWLFPSPHDDGQRPIGSNTVNAILRRVCKEAGISGRHVHCHGIRKFVVCRLMAEQNRVEDVAKFIGHRSVNVTYRTYWDWDLNELVAGMKIPWLSDDARE